MRDDLCLRAAAIAASVIAVGAFATTASAHHSFAMFDLSQHVLHLTPRDQPRQRVRAVRIVSEPRGETVDAVRHALKIPVLIVNL